mmetsp:Transcript_10353/g.31195  ORF Transcript_10353/g.31195 Transcript_10353/m.31195 type:complete len:220 (+) Transcript_10353:170-829(+)
MSGQTRRPSGRPHRRHKLQAAPTGLQPRARPLANEHTPACLRERAGTPTGAAPPHLFLPLLFFSFPSFLRGLGLLLLSLLRFLLRLLFRLLLLFFFPLALLPRLLRLLGLLLRPRLRPAFWLPPARPLLCLPFGVLLRLRLRLRFGLLLSARLAFCFFFFFLLRLRLRLTASWASCSSLAMCCWRSAFIILRIVASSMSWPPVPPKSCSAKRLSRSASV